MLKCPKCGKEMVEDNTEDFDFLFCIECAEGYDINKIAERCEKAEAECEKAKEDSLKSIEYSEQLSNKLFKAEADLEAVKGIAKDFVDLGRYTPITQLHIRDFVNTIIKLLKGGE